MTAQVAIVLNQARQALCIPVSALAERQKDGRATVKVLAGEQVEVRAIQTGISNNVQIQVVNGLREGKRSSSVTAPTCRRVIEHHASSPGETVGMAKPLLEIDAVVRRFSTGASRWRSQRDRT